MVATAIALLLESVYKQGAGSQIEVATLTTENACSELKRKYIWAIQNKSFEPSRELQFQNALLEIILDHYTGVEGGFWSKEKGFSGYAYPTYEGSGIKRDVPEAEKTALAKTSAQAIGDLKAVTDLSRGSREAMIITACPIVANNQNTVAWVMARVAIGAGLAYDRFIWGLGLLLAFVLLTGASATILLYRWSKNLSSLEAAIKNHSLETLPDLPQAKERELESIVTAFNSLSARAKEAKLESQALTKRLAQADRLSALGKMAAGIAHEIRNPLATIRLKFENSVVAPSERIPQAAPIILDQIMRIERLIQMVLAMTQSFELKPQTVEIESWWKSSFPTTSQLADDKQIQLIFQSTVEEWSFDPFHLSRALENLLANAIAFSRASGVVSLLIHAHDQLLTFDITDSGPGVDPAMRKKLFEPFASARPGGTGLGLLLVREIVEAHGGRVSEIPSNLGAHFRMEIPWLKF